MAKSKSKAPSGSKTFPIVITVIVVAMIAVVALSVISSKEKAKAQTENEFSDAPTVSAVSINGKLGESTLPKFTKEVAASGSDPAVGMIVPEITANQFNGKPLTITPGKDPYVLAFLAHWCVHCNKEVPIIVNLEKQNKLPEGVEFFAVATGTSDKEINFPPSQWLEDRGWPWRKIADDKQFSVADKLGLTGYPYLIFVNADGTVSQRISGEQNENAYIEAANKIAQSAKQ